MDSLSTQSQASNLIRPIEGRLLRQLERELDKYQSKVPGLEALIGDTGPYLEGILDNLSLSVANITNAHHDDNWLQFESDSESYFHNRQVDSQFESVSSQWRVNAFIVGASGSSYNSKSQLNFQKSTSNSIMRVKGELLRVTIKIV